MREAPYLSKAEALPGCPKCEDMKKIQQLPYSLFHQQQLEQLQQHLNDAVYQRDLFNKIRTNLKKDQLLIVQDFTKHYLEADKVNDFIITIFYLNSTTNKLEYRYFDYFGCYTSQNVDFVKAAWLQLLSSEHIQISQYSTIYLWSDGGPQHFKTLNTIAFWDELSFQYEIAFEIHFFVSN